MKEKLLQLQQQIDALNQRERILILLTALVTVVMLLQLFLVDPLLERRTAAKRQIASLNADIVNGRGQQQVLQAELTVGVNRDKIRQRDRLSRELETLNDNIQQSVVAMIPPKLMPEVLETLLGKSKGLKLLSLENKAVTTVLTQQQLAAEDSSQSAGQALYQHGFVLRLEGDYPSIIRYFEALAALPWRFYWDKLHYQVEQYPTAVIQLEVHTVSMAEEWIGV